MASFPSNKTCLLSLRVYLCCEIVITVKSHYTVWHIYVHFSFPMLSSLFCYVPQVCLAGSLNPAPWQANVVLPYNHDSLLVVLFELHIMSRWVAVRKFLCISSVVGVEIRETWLLFIVTPIGGVIIQAIDWIQTAAADENGSAELVEWWVLVGMSSYQTTVRKWASVGWWDCLNMFCKKTHFRPLLA